MPFAKTAPCRFADAKVVHFSESAKKNGRKL